MTDNPNYTRGELQAMGLSLEQIEAKPKGAVWYCSFCGKRDSDCLTLVAGPTVFICDGCVDLCVEIVAMKRDEAAAITIDQPKE